MSNPRVLITSHFLRAGCEVDGYLRNAGLEPLFKQCHSEEEMIEALQGVDGIICSSDPLSARVIESAEKLKVIARTGVGYNTVDVKAATARGIPVCTLPGANRHAVAEYAFTLMLACARNLLQNLDEVQKGGWKSYDGLELAGKTLGIVGLGTIGKEVAQRARAFEMRILAHDVVRDEQFAEAYGVSYVSLEQLLRESDLVSLHCFLDKNSYHLIDAERLALMKPTAILINTSRGGVVDSEALYQAIQEKRIAGAGLDVHEQEPLGESPLRGLPNVLLSPHAGAATVEYRSRAPFLAADAVIQTLRGERPAHPVNPGVFRR
ncbi:MAG: phosphoglycerate dehydrogenase [Chloroflexi bacterium]|nr:phosphoglycerate dehydrogenase [Chloroflexota bacterium]